MFVYSDWNLVGTRVVNTLGYWQSELLDNIANLDELSIFTLIANRHYFLRNAV